MCRPAEPTTEYCCPGEKYPITRAVHLGRLARFYSGCRQCPHRDDTGSLSIKQVEQLTETRPRGEARDLFHEEGVGGVYLNDMRPGLVRELAAALGVLLSRDRTEDDAPPTVAIAGDGRSITSELVASVGDGLRWAGCHVVDIGPATSACLAFAIDHLEADGGMLLGNLDGQAQTIGLRFWAFGPCPLSTGGTLEPLREIYQAGIDRPAVEYGPLRRFQANEPYLAGLAALYHALRPLRFVLETTSEPIRRYLNELTANVACEVIAGQSKLDRLPEQVLQQRAHFGILIDDDGETCRVSDEQGRPIPAERLLLLVLRHVLTDREDSAVVLEDGCSPALLRAIDSQGVCRVKSRSRRAEMERAVCDRRAIFGGGASRRFWYAIAGPPLPDALMTLTLLLGILSRSDRPLSVVLDQDASLE